MNCNLHIVQIKDHSFYYVWHASDKHFFLFQETHVIKYHGADFYGMNLKIALLGYLRGELNFSSVEELKKAINQDIVNSEKYLDSPNAQTFKDHKFFVCT